MALLLNGLAARLFGPRRDERQDVALYAAVVAAARQPAFYLDFAVPDTVDGRFDLIALHAILTMRRLKGQGAAAAERSQRLYEAMVDDFDRSLREMGVGDTGVGKRVKAMLRGVHGRILAYDAALADPDPARLDVVLDNNLYGTVRAVEPAVLAAMAGYVRDAVRALDAQPLAMVMAGVPGFPAPAAPPHP